MVGWYSTGPRLREADLDINALLSNYAETPVLVICEVNVSTRPHLPFPYILLIKPLKLSLGSLQSLEVNSKSFAARHISNVLWTMDNCLLTIGHIKAIYLHPAEKRMSVHVA